MKGAFDVQKSWFRVRVDQMFFDFDFRPVRRLAGVTTDRRHRQWRFRLISRSRTLRVCADVTDAAATAIAVDATAIAVDITGIASNVTSAAATTIAVNVTAIANNVTGITIDATVTAVDATAIVVDATAAVTDATSAVTDTTSAVTDANITAVNDATDFRHRHLLLLPWTSMVVVLSAVARRYGRIS